MQKDSMVLQSTMAILMVLVEVSLSGVNMYKVTNSYCAFMAVCIRFSSETTLSYPSSDNLFSAKKVKNVTIIRFP